MQNIALTNVARAARLNFRHATGILCLLIINGCALQPASGPENSANLLGRRPSAEIAPWIANGKLALRSEDGSDHVNFRWQRFSKDNEAVSLSGPIGFGAIRIIRERENIWWMKDDQRLPLAALALTQAGHATLATLPFAELGNWLLGVVEDTSPWRVAIDSFQYKNGWQLPRKLSMRLPIQALQPATEVTLTVVVLEWQIASAKTHVPASTP